MKICTKCGDEKYLGDFHVDKSNLDGLYSYCKSCKSILNAEYRANHKICKAILERYSASRIKMALSYHTPIIPREKIHIATPNYALMIDSIKLSTPIEDYSGSLTVGDCK